MQEYIDANPSDLETTKALALLLIEQKEYYKGFGYLEYYAAQKQTPEASILLAKNYYWHGFSKEALDVLETLLKREPENVEAFKLKGKILKVAPRFTTSNSGATTDSYFNSLSKKQLTVADTLYFNAHYIAALEYYQNYLRTNPDDHKVRYRYAFALEHAKEHGKAEGEFSLLFWTEDSDELRYHYAYNMIKNGKCESAKKQLLELKKNVYKKLDDNLSLFLESWELGWESQDFTNYASHYDASFLQNQLWSFRKQEMFAQMNYIAVGVYDPVYKQLDANSYEIRFFQEYSTNKNADNGYKTLQIVCSQDKSECRIVKEQWKQGEYTKELLLTPYIEKALKECEHFKEKPLALSTKKKLYSHNNKSAKIS